MKKLSAIATMFIALAAQAQTPPKADPAKPTTQPAATGDAKPATPAAQAPAAATEDVKAKRERLLKATQLPKRASEIRGKGMAPADVKEAMEAAKSKRVKAGDMAEVTEEQSKSIDEHGPIDNFGAFVKSKLNEGLRGRDLSAAIKAEHAKRGKGKGAGKGNDQKGDEKGKRDDKAKDGDKGKTDEHGKPDDKGKSDDKNKSDDKGKPEQKGKPDKGKGK